MKKLVLAICIGVFAAMSVVTFVQSTQESLEGGVIRLHVRANSNLTEDQQLKLKVRDRILAQTKDMAKGVSDVKDAQKLIEDNLPSLKDAAMDEINLHGYDYPVNIEFGKSKFPARTYGGITLPAGTYKALTVNIGTGEGENWWCVMFPPLCFTRETVATPDSSSEEMLIENLGSDTYSMLNSGKVQVKFKIYEFIQSMR